MNLWTNNRIRMILTGACNLDCFYCHNEGQPKNSSFMSSELFEHVIRLITKTGQRLEAVTFSGGEPLLHQQLEEMISRIRPLTNRVTLVTNGTLLDRERLTSLRLAGLDKIRLGIDSLQRKRSRPSRIQGPNVTGTDIITMISESNFPFEMNVVLTAYNSMEISEIIRFCRDHEISAKFFEQVQVSNLGTTTGQGEALSTPFMTFEEFDAVLRSVIPDARPQDCPQMGPANSVYVFSKFSLRYCRFLCDFGACYMTGTRIDSRGFVYNCVVGSGIYRLNPADSLDESARTIAMSVRAGCQGRARHRAAAV